MVLVVRKRRHFMDTKEILEQFDLREKESAIYVAALELGTSTASAVAKRAGIQRTHFYDLSLKLINAGFLKRVSKGKKHLFTATEPDALVEMQENNLRRLRQMLPELKAIHNTSGQKPKIFYYEGEDGINLIYEDTLNYKGEILAFTTPQFFSEHIKNTGSEYIKKRIALGNNARVIGENAPAIREQQKRDTEELRETKILSPEIYSSEVDIGIYGNKIYVIDYKEQFGFILEGSEIASVMKMIFEIVWSKWKA